MCRQYFTINAMKGSFGSIETNNKFSMLMENVSFGDSGTLNQVLLGILFSILDPYFTKNLLFLDLFRIYKLLGKSKLSIG